MLLIRCIQPFATQQDGEKCKVGSDNGFTGSPAHNGQLRGGGVGGRVEGWGAGVGLLGGSRDQLYLGMVAPSQVLCQARRLAGKRTKKLRPELYLEERVSDIKCFFSGSSLSSA